jgi:hypothetical protein
MVLLHRFMKKTQATPKARGRDRSDTSSRRSEEGMNKHIGVSPVHSGSGSRWCPSPARRAVDHAAVFAKRGELPEERLLRRHPRLPLASGRLHVTPTGHARRTRCLNHLANDPHNLSYGPR